MISTREISPRPYERSEELLTLLQRDRQELGRGHVQGWLPGGHGIQCVSLPPHFTSNLCLYVLKNIIGVKEDCVCTITLTWEFERGQSPQNL